MTLFQYLSESPLEDISTENKLYHRTNLKALISILGEEKLKGFKYIINIDHLRGHFDPYLQIKYPEIATARKATFSTADRKGEGAVEKLTLDAGAVELELFKDRLKTLRSVRIKPIDEYGEREGEERVELRKVDYIPMSTKYLKIRVLPKRLEKDFEINMKDYGSRYNTIKNLKILKKLIEKNKELFIQDHNFKYFIVWLDDKIEQFEVRK